MRFAEYRQGKIRYNVRGEGRAVVLLHGFLEDLNMWNGYANKLAGKNRRVICVDLPGHGKSDSFGYVHEPALMAEAVKAVLDKEKIRKATVVGHSMGGYTAMAMGEHFPDSVRGICMFFSTARDDSSEKKDVRGKVSRLIKIDHESFIRKNVPHLFLPQKRKLFKKEINLMKKRAVANMTKRAVLAANEGMRVRPDREIVLKFAPYPVHFIIGKLDPVIAPEPIIEQTRHHDGLTYDLLENCGHMGHLENRHACFQLLKQFLVKCGS